METAKTSTQGNKIRLLLKHFLIGLMLWLVAYLPAELGRVKVNESVKDESNVNESGEHHIEFFKA